MVRTTVVGTYPRIGDTYAEQSLRRAIAQVDKGDADPSSVIAAEREVVAAVLHEQVEAGIDLITDGQISWYDSQSHVARSLSGVEIDGLVRYFDTNTYYRQPVVRGPVAWKESILENEWRYAQSQSEAPVKAVLTGPVTLASLALDKHYGKLRPLVRDLAAALASEVRALVAAGAKHVQIDEPVLTRKPEHLSLVSEGLDSIAAEKGSAELTLFTYFGDVARIYRDLLELPADVLGLDLVQGSRTSAQVEKHGSEKPLVLGVIDARNTKREDPSQVASQVREWGASLELASCYLSPSNGLEFLPRARAREKLGILVETARRLGGSA